MNAPTIWIVGPVVIAISLYVFQRWESSVHAIGIGTAFILAWLAWQLPVGEAVATRFWAGLPSLRIAESLTFLGQRFVINNASRPIIMLIYLMIGFWFCGAYLARVDRLFVPLGMIISALQVSALAVETSWQAPLILELIALVTVPLLSPPGTARGRGALRFITFQTIGVCLVLFSERWWLISLTAVSGFEGIPLPLLTMGLGYAFLLAVFPFHTWVPMSAEEINPYTAAFIFYTLPSGITLLMLKNLDHYILLGAPTELFAGLLGIGILMILAGGAWAAFERHLGRVLAFVALTQTGVLLLSLSLRSEMVHNPFLAGILLLQLITMGIGLIVWALALQIIQFQAPDLLIDSARGLARSLPIASICLLLAQLSLSGLPLLASFPIYNAIWTMLGQRSARSVLFFMIGIALLFIASLRTLASLAESKTIEIHPLFQPKLHSLFMILGVTILLIEGFAPQWFLPSMTRLGGIFMGVNP